MLLNMGKLNMRKKRKDVADLIALWVELDSIEDNLSNAETSLAKIKQLLEQIETENHFGEKVRNVIYNNIEACHKLRNIRIGIYNIKRSYNIPFHKHETLQNQPADAKNESIVLREGVNEKEKENENEKEKERCS